jgi:type IV pilus assembly protein PilX
MERRLIPPAAAAAAPTRQRGLAMIVALLVLVAMSLAAVALVRSVNTGAQIAGNLSFRQDATANADRVAQEAVAMLYAKLVADPDSLNNNLVSEGYYASQPHKLDPTGNARTSDNERVLIEWDSGYCSTFPTNSHASCTHKPKASTATLTTGNSASYIVLRMCDAAGSVDVSTTLCATAAASVANTCQGAINYENEGKCPSGAGVTPYYRVLVRTMGPRNTTSYTETVVHF